MQEKIETLHVDIYVYREATGVSQVPGGTGLTLEVEGAL